MNRRIKTSSKPLPSVRTTSRRAPSIDGTMVAKALGAEDVSKQDTQLQGSPPALFALRQELYQRLWAMRHEQSLEGTAQYQKIPISDEDWGRLRKLAEFSHNEGIYPTPEQVASILLHQALATLDED
jgi:hypothetical protein